MPYVDLDEEDEAQECTIENQDSAIEQLAAAIQRLADTNIDRTLFGNFWLNEIKSLDDTIRLIINIDILLIAGYSTIIATNFKTVSSSLTRFNFLPTLDLVIFIIIIIPILPWIFSIEMSGMNHKLPPQKAEPLLDNERASDYLINIYWRRRYIENAALTQLFLGLSYTFFMFIGYVFVAMIDKPHSYLLFCLVIGELYFSAHMFLDFHNSKNTKYIKDW